MPEAAYGPLDHPQRQDGEVYMGRCWKAWSPEQDRDRGWADGWKTSRTGDLEPEYDSHHRLRNSLPWFVQEKELAGAGVWDPAGKRFLGEWDEPGIYT